MTAKRSREVSSPRTTIRDIAARAGVSVATVSRVLNGHPDVSTTTRERVLQYIREEGYATNRSARSLTQGRTGLIAVTVPFIHAEYFGEIVEGAAEALYERDARFVLCPTQHQHDREVSLLDRLMHGTTDGAMLLLPSESNTELRLLLDQGYPFVVVDPRILPAPDIPTVAAAHLAGARIAMDHLLSLGHERVAAITGPAGWLATEERLVGYYSKLLSAGLPAPGEMIRETEFLIEGGYQAAHSLLDEPNPPTAVFAFNDNIAIGVLRAARERGVHVPIDLSVVGFDDMQTASLVSPALTTVRQPLQEMGRMAVSLLGRLLDGRPVEAAHVELSTRLVVRESTAPPRSSLAVG